MPSAPPLITGVWPDGLRKLTIGGASTTGVAGDVVYAGLINGNHAWSTDGSQTAGLNTIVEYTGTQWKVSYSSTYSALKTSAATDPVGLTSWTVGTGTGSPTIAAAAQSVPAVIYAAPGNSPSAPPIITA
jgi:hypothetical protein